MFVDIVDENEFRRAIPGISRKHEKHSFHFYCV